MSRRKVLVGETVPSGVLGLWFAFWVKALLVSTAPGSAVGGVLCGSNVFATKTAVLTTWAEVLGSGVNIGLDGGKFMIPIPNRTSSIRRASPTAAKIVKRRVWGSNCRSIIT
jgi:hypothetical protein